MLTTRASETELRAAVESVPDPEVPVLTIADLGILRSMAADPHTGVVDVVVTPTYSGCPAMAAITGHVSHVCRRAGWEPRVTTALDPVWTTDWMSDAGKEKLRRYGIAPPSHTPLAGAVPVSLGRRVVECPRCGSADTEELARFGSTACKALRRCSACRETFDEFKTF